MRRVVVLTTIALTIVLFGGVFFSVFVQGSEYVGNAEQHTAVRSYLQGPLFAENTLPFFTDAEQSHMTDVKRLFDIGWLLFLTAIGTIVGIVGVFLYKKWHAALEELTGKTLRWTGWAILGLCFVIGLGAVINFDIFWTLFHVILFPQGNWYFPVESTIIQLYPQAFFEQFTFRFGLRILIIGAVAVFLGTFMTRMQQHEQFFRNVQKPRKKRKKQ